MITESLYREEMFINVLKHASTDKTDFKPTYLYGTFHSHPTVFDERDFLKNIF